jgi:peptidoglycan/LPS O-acetylase OafA/YrhL
MGSYAHSAVNIRINAMNRVNSLTSLRFFAALGVLLFHFPITFDGVIGQAYHLIASHGYTGVTFFFILSGFLLATIYSERPLTSKSDLKKFYLKRFIRIVPTYWFVLMIAAFFMRGQLGMAKAQGVLLERLGDVVLHITLLQSWVPASPFRLHWNEPSWSVSVELVYYLLFPIILILVCKARDSWSRSLIGLGVVALLHGLIFFVRQGNWNQSSSGSMRDMLNLPFSSLTVFAFGMFGAMLVKELLKHNINPLVWKLSFWLGCLMVLAFAFLNNEINPFTQILLCSGMTLVVSGGSQYQGYVERFLSLPILLVLGEASYALYLIQRPTDEWLKYFWRNPSSTNTYNVVVIISSIVASVLIWQFFEKPAGRWLTSRLIKKS